MAAVEPPAEYQVAPVYDAQPSTQADNAAAPGQDNSTQGITRDLIMQWVHDGKPNTTNDMYFYASKNGTLLFKSWDIDSDLEFWLAVTGIFALGVIYEMVKSFRSCLIQEANSSVAPENKPLVGYTQKDSRGCLEKFCMHTMISAVYLVEVILSFTLMLIFMSFNVYFCLPCVGGIAMGYFIFGSGRVYAGHH